MTSWSWCCPRPGAAQRGDPARRLRRWLATSSPRPTDCEPIRSVSTSRSRTSPSMAPTQASSRRRPSTRKASTRSRGIEGRSGGVAWPRAPCGCRRARPRAGSPDRAPAAGAWRVRSSSRRARRPSPARRRRRHRSRSRWRPRPARRPGPGRSWGWGPGAVLTLAQQLFQRTQSGDVAGEQLGLDLPERGPASPRTVEVTSISTSRSASCRRCRATRCGGARW